LIVEGNVVGLPTTVTSIRDCRSGRRGRLSNPTAITGGSVAQPDRRSHVDVIQTQILGDDVRAALKGWFGVIGMMLKD
jgi:hypothetical protein